MWIRLFPRHLWKPSQILGIGPRGILLCLVFALTCLVDPALFAASEPVDRTAADGITDHGRDAATNGLVFRPGDSTIERLDAGEFAQHDHELTRPVPERTPETATKDRIRDWTILFYDDADFDNAYDPLNDFSNDVYSSANLDVILLQDTNYGPAYLWHLPGGGARTLLASMGASDMGDFSTLRDFIQYGKDHYPADRYLLCLYDHGGGYSGACVDQTCDPATALTMEDFQVAITETGGIDIIAFTAPCLMGSVECVYELRDCVDVYVGSEDLSGFALWHGIFHDLCDLLVASAGVTNEAIAQYMVQLVSENDYWPDPWSTMSAMSSEHVSALAERIDDLANYLGVHIVDYSSNIELARAGMWVVAQYYYTDFNRVDLVSAMQQLGGTIFDFHVQQKVTEILTAFDQTIIAEWHGANQTGAHGLSIYFPRLESSYYETYHMSLLDFADDLSWDEFLLAYYAGTPTTVDGNLAGSDPIASNSPNPFQQATNISFYSRVTGNVTLRVYDIAGRLVQTLWHEPSVPGNLSFMWDGRNEEGRLVPSGVYFYRLEIGDQVQTRRLTLIR